MPDFRDLIEQEHRFLGDQEPSYVIAKPGASGEPRVVDTNAQRFGLALSGGGIRSATYNLGVLQALAELGVLQHVDYLATVSGGGYIGGWWTAWRRRAGAGKTFPQGEEAEHELRHLREFSKYLSPRWSIGSLESWLFVVTGVAIMLPALVATAALLGIMAIAFNSLAEVQIFVQSRVLRCASIGVLTFAVLAVFDHLWRRRAASEQKVVDVAGFLALAALAAAGTAAFASLFETSTIPDQAMLLPFGGESPQVILLLLRPTWAWLSVYATLAVLRYLLTRAGTWPPGVMLRGKVDRINARLFALACAWTAMALLWEGGRWVASYPMFSIAPEPLLFGVAFVVLLTWRSSQVPPNIPHAPSRWRSLLDAIPLLIAYAVLIVALVTTVTVLIRCLRDWQLSEWEVTAIALGGLLFTILTFDPAESGLHAGYRARIARAYLGSQPIRTSDGWAPNRAAEPQRGDDFPVQRLRHLGRPLHLVCCAANDLSGDPLRNLNRGARSATASALGLAVGNSFVPWPDRGPTFASLITASAASFNPNMGDVSMRTGPVVRFLATALNLRLGLWLPAVTRGRLGQWLDRWLPGRLFYAELMGLTRADLSPHVHLSDGSHFDNSGIYELVRRRCRFILLCDCGQDVSVAFDDIGNTIRKLRQDFDIEVRIDLDPLRVNDKGISRQHVAVGEIEYAPDDFGTLIVLKPTLTGDEPVDVRQYKTRNVHFPHEPNRNQFYDAAQWESYRRLGYHSAMSAFAIVNGLAGEPTAAHVFAAMRTRWYPTPGDFTDSLLGLTQRFSELENRVRQSGPLWFQLELFPELLEVDHAGAAATAPPTLEDRHRVLTLLLQFTQLMEDVWVGCRLETHWSHPLNSGWMSYFHRWTSTPSFRMWWPILRPLFSRGLRQFAKERFRLLSPGDDLVASDGERPVGEVTPLGSGFGDRLASRAWLDAGLPPPLPEQQVFQYLLHLRPNPNDDFAVQAGVCAVQVAREADALTARWRSADFFIVPSLRGAGIERAFLVELTRRLQEQGCTAFRVELANADGEDGGSERARRDLVEFYVREGYVRAHDADNVFVLRAP